MSEEFERLIRQLGEAVHHQVDSDLAGRDWVHAFLDVRYQRTGESWRSKIRAMRFDGEFVSVKMSNDIDVCLISLNFFRKSFGDEWYGIVLTVESDRRCQIKLNYDPDCSLGESFYDT
jgi:hypothetical protein